MKVTDGLRRNYKFTYKVVNEQEPYTETGQWLVACIASELINSARPT